MRVLWYNSSEYYGGKMSDFDTRKGYNQAVTILYKEIYAPKFKEIHDNNMCFGDDLAMEAFYARDSIKKQYQGETSKFGLFFIGLHNIWNYGTWQNPSYEYFRQFKSPEEIAYSAFKTSGKDLCLEGNGLDTMYSDWKIAHSVNSTLYPENMYPDLSGFPA